MGKQILPPARNSLESIAPSHHVPPSTRTIKVIKLAVWTHVKNDRTQRIAALMGKYPSLGMVSQFSSPNIQSLPYQQAELIGLRQDLHGLEIANDRSPDPGKASFSKNWLALSQAKEDDGSDVEWKLVLSTREQLKEYSEWIRVVSLAGSVLSRCAQMNLSFWTPRLLRWTGRARGIWVPCKSGCKDLPWAVYFSSDEITMFGATAKTWLPWKEEGKTIHSQLWLGDTLTPLYHYAFGKYHRVSFPMTLQISGTTTSLEIRYGRSSICAKYGALFWSYDLSQLGSQGLTLFPYSVRMELTTRSKFGSWKMPRTRAANDLNTVYRAWLNLLVTKLLESSMQ